MADQIQAPEAPPQSGDQPKQPAPPPRDQRQPADPPPDRGFLREHPIKAFIGLLVVAGLLIGGFLFWNYSQTYESTDDAFIDGHTNYISPRIAGTVSNVLVVENQFVKEG